MFDTFASILINIRFSPLYLGLRGRYVWILMELQDTFRGTEIMLLGYGDKIAVPATRFIRNWFQEKIKLFSGFPLLGYGNRKLTHLQYTIVYFDVKGITIT